MKEFVIQPPEVQHAISACIEERDRLRAENEALKDSLIARDSLLVDEVELLRAELEEQARLLGMSGDRELALRAENKKLLRIMRDAFDEAGQPEFAEWDEIRDALRGEGE
jgi:hypothetical protein